MQNMYKKMLSPVIKREAAFVQSIVCWNKYEKGAPSLQNRDLSWILQNAQDPKSTLVIIDEFSIDERNKKDGN